MEIDTKLLDELLAKHGHRPEDIGGANGLLKQLTKALLERVMQAELTDHRGYEKHDPAGYKTGNSHNGKTPKKLKGNIGEVELETPRDRNGTFEPKIVPKGQTRFTGFDARILSMYSRGMSTRDIQSHLEEMYGIEVSPSLVSTVTEAVQDEVRTWQSRPLEAVYPNRCVGPDISGTPLKPHIQTSHRLRPCAVMWHNWSVKGRRWPLETAAGEAAWLEDGLALQAQRAFQGGFEAQHDQDHC